MPGGGASPVVPPGTRAPSAVARLGGQVRAGDERPTGPDGRLPQRATTTRRAAVTLNRHASAVIEFPSDLEIVTTREFDTPIELVFDVLTKPEHVRNWFAPFEDKMTVCSIDLRVGGNYHLVFVTDDGTECSFRGTYLEIERPTRIVDTWLLDRKSTRLNSSHTVISYAVFCLKKKKNKDHNVKHELNLSGFLFHMRQINSSQYADD